MYDRCLECIQKLPDTTDQWYFRPLLLSVADDTGQAVHKIYAGPRLVAKLLMNCDPRHAQDRPHVVTTALTALLHETNSPYVMKLLINNEEDVHGFSKTKQFTLDMLHLGEIM